MTAKITYREQTYEVEAGLTVKEALIQIGLEPQLYLAARAGQLVTDDQKLQPDDQIKLVAIISGGNLIDSGLTQSRKRGVNLGCAGRSAPRAA